MKTRLVNAYAHFGRARFVMEGFPDSDPGTAAVLKVISSYFPGDRRISEVVREEVQAVPGFHPAFIVYRFRDNAVTVTYREINHD